ncbi:hypothetical protein AX16_008524 [Volvariella volvacea WC 439]|nr:hypothetical protein AX16_008524 [Volvariella volvacea WC 439]
MILETLSERWRTLAATTLFAVIIVRALSFLSNRRTFKHFAIISPPFQPLMPPGVLIPRSWWNPGFTFTWYWRLRFYKEAESETVAVVSWLQNAVLLYTSNIEIIRQVAGAITNRPGWQKPWITNRAVLSWGMSVLSADGEMWKKHRRLLTPVFSNDLYQMVWKESCKLYREMLSEEGWDKRDIVDIPVAQKVIFKLALLVLGNCGFGMSFNWSDPPYGPDGQMSLQEALCTMSERVMAACMAPTWMTYLPIDYLQKIRIARTQLEKFMNDQIADRMDVVGGGGKNANSDLLTRLVHASYEGENPDDVGAEGDGEKKLTLNRNEIIGNMFTFLFAGHETTANSLVAVLGLLSIHDDIQNEIYEHIISVIGNNKSDPAPGDYYKLNKVLAVFYEAVRMYPSGQNFVREAAEDMVIQVPNPVGQEGYTSVTIPKGTWVVCDMIGSQYNERYFDEPEKFKPSRWYDIANESEVFTAFSVGSRACIGRKFATVESVCFLTLLLRDWRVEPLLTPTGSKSLKEMREDWVKKLGEVNIAMTMGIVDLPIRFVRRS